MFSFSCSKCKILWQEKLYIKPRKKKMKQTEEIRPDITLETRKESVKSGCKDIGMQRKFNYKNLIGERFGKLIVESFSHNHLTRPTLVWLCKCDCGNYKLILGENLTKTKGTKSCGCLAILTQTPTIHGQSNNRTYKSWNALKNRCLNVNDEHYWDYGGRGITVCEKWLTFEGFYEDMGDRPEGMTLHRKNNYKGYNKENCVWADAKTQSREKRNNTLITFKGKTKCLSAWAEEYHLPANTIINRLKRLWGIEKSLTTPSPSSLKILRT